MAWESAGELVAILVQGVVEGVLGRKRPPRLPNDPTFLESFGLAFGTVLVLASALGYATHLYQWKQESNVLTHPPARAVIVSIKRENSFTDALIDYERQTPAGPVVCKNAPARFEDWSHDLEVGKIVEVYPQPGSCYRPIYAPDIGDSQTTKIVSLIALPIGVALFIAGYSSLQRRRRQAAAPHQG